MNLGRRVGARPSLARSARGVRVPGRPPSRRRGAEAAHLLGKEAVRVRLPTSAPSSRPVRWSRRRGYEPWNRGSSILSRGATWPAQRIWARASEARGAAFDSPAGRHPALSGGSGRGPPKPVARGSTPRGSTSLRAWRKGSSRLAHNQEIAGFNSRARYHLADERRAQRGPISRSSRGSIPPVGITRVERSQRTHRAHTSVSPGAAPGTRTTFTLA